MLSSYSEVRHAPHDYAARSRHRPDYSAVAVARSHKHDAAERARCAPCAGRLARGCSAATGDEYGGHQGEGRHRFPQRRAYRNSNDKLPTVVFFHGGGWVAGDLDTHDRQARWLAIETGSVGISVAYRRPPETRFPGAFDDALSAGPGLVRRTGEFGGGGRPVGGPRGRGRRKLAAR